MAGTAKSEISIEQLQGFKQLRRVAALLSAVHTCGCDRDKAANRELHFDDYVLLDSNLPIQGPPLTWSSSVIHPDFPDLLSGEADGRLVS